MVAAFSSAQVARHSPGATLRSPTSRPSSRAFSDCRGHRTNCLLHIEFTEHDGMGLAPEMICFNLRGEDWRQRLPAIRSVAAEFGLQPFQDEEIQSSWSLTFRMAPEGARLRWCWLFLRTASRQEAVIRMNMAGNTRRQTLCRTRHRYERQHSAAGRVHADRVADCHCHHR